MADPEKNEPQDENNKPIEGVFNISPEVLKKIMDEAKPLMDIFFDIYTKEKTPEEQIAITHQQGMPGVIGNLIDQTIPQTLLMIAPANFVELAQKCLLFGYVLDEIIKRVESQNKDLSLDDLEKLWNMGEEESNDNES